MASKITKKMNIGIEGILDLTKEYDGKKFKINGAYGEDL